MQKIKLFLTGLFTLTCHLFVWSAEPDSLRYVDASAFTLIGKGFSDTETRYERLPVRLKDISRPPVWSLSKNCSGMAIRFRTDSPIIAAKWEVTRDVVMNHFTPTGIKGLDLYCLNRGKWQFVNSARPTGKSSSAVIINHMNKEVKEFMLYLPLYDGLSKLEIGIEQEASIAGPTDDSPKMGKPVVFYGTSITQGGCATRPGMSYPSILSRMLDREIINLGFSGNGRLDLEIAEVMAELDASCFVIDCLPNVTEELMKEKYVRFLEIIREKKPTTPLILVENIHYTHLDFDQEVSRLIDGKNRLLFSIWKKLKQNGDKNLFIIKADGLIGKDLEGTVDGVHLTDLGFLRMAENMYPLIKRRL
jgi:hypothetical protein